MFDCCGVPNVLAMLESKPGCCSLTAFSIFNAPPGLATSELRAARMPGTPALRAFCRVARSMPNAVDARATMSGVMNCVMSETILVVAMRHSLF